MILKNIIILFFIHLSCLGFAAENDFSGTLYGDISYGENKTAETPSFFDLDLDWQHQKQDSKLYLELNLKAIAKEEGTKFEYDLKEAYWHANINTFQYTIGKSVLRWGKSDLLSPLDVWIGKDLRYFYKDEERSYLATPLLITMNKNQVNTYRKCIRYKSTKNKKRKYKKKKRSRKRNIKRKYRTTRKSKRKRQRKCIKYKNIEYITPHSYEFVLGVIPVTNKISDLELDQINIIKNEIEIDVDNIEIGLKYLYNQNNWSLGVMSFYGFNRTPYLNYDSSENEIIQVYKKFYMLGLELEKSFDYWVIRSDLALKQTEENSDSSLNDFQSHGELVFSIERRIGDHLRFVLYPSIKKHFNYSSTEHVESSNDYNITEKLLYTEVNSLIHESTDEVIQKIGTRLAYDNEESGLSIQLIVLKNLVKKDSVVQLDIKYSGFSDHYQLGAGVVKYSGNSNTLLGQLVSRNAGYINGVFWF
ncbi:MAG: hypothetical protein HN576_07260 [Bacteriovoracaceae bacterium]|jgi:hypothetical protein|nr:hypothetical protein [Bacteriovoracaceae bacterium]